MIRLAEIKDVGGVVERLRKPRFVGLRPDNAGSGEDDTSLEESLFADLEAISEELKDREFQLTLSGEYDTRNAILAIHAGAGGTESQDWAQMLMRMYLRWTERRRYKSEILDMSPGDEAGVKSAVISVEGRHAYGYLKAEGGTHRLVRLSPFDSAHMRHTSFALVEVLPEAEERVDVTINPDDLRIDVYRASGHGGQAVQKNSTAVRITHQPSGVVVTCQNERSQFQNKEFAMKVLRARLMELEIKRRAEEQAKLKGEHVSAEWGSQIRSYVLHPYKMVRTTAPATRRRTRRSPGRRPGPTDSGVPPGHCGEGWIGHGPLFPLLIWFDKLTHERRPTPFSRCGRPVAHRFDACGLR